MNEREGRKVLRRRFEAAGLHITESHVIEVDGLAIELDGYDAERGIGYEYITTEAGDREGVTPELVDALERHMDAGDLYVLLVDERDIPDRGLLDRAAEGFLGRLRALGKI